MPPTTAGSRPPRRPAAKLRRRASAAASAFGHVNAFPHGQLLIETPSREGYGGSGRENDLSAHGWFTCSPREPAYAAQPTIVKLSDCTADCRPGESRAVSETL